MYCNMCIQAYNSSSPSSGGSQGMPNRAHSSLFSLKPSNRVMDLLPTTRKLAYVKRTPMVQPFILRYGLPTQVQEELKTSRNNNNNRTSWKSADEPQKEKAPHETPFTISNVADYLFVCRIIIDYWIRWWQGRCNCSTHPFALPSSFVSVFLPEFLASKWRKKNSGSKKPVVLTPAWIHDRNNHIP